MALHKLLVDDFYDDIYMLIAIHCRLEDYRLAYLLNKKLGLKLKRKQEDITLRNLAVYPIFEWNNKSEYVTWNMVANVSKTQVKPTINKGLLFGNNEKELKTNHLIPEYKTVDYFVKISNEIHNIDQKLVLNTIKRIPQIITSYSLNPTQIKSKEYLIF